jgi:hypothetical protein
MKRDTPNHWGGPAARPSDCRIETRLDARRSDATTILRNPAEYLSSSGGKSVETSLDAADTSVRATQAA